MTGKMRRKITEKDVLGALVALSALPRRGAEREELDVTAYVVALDGVSADDLANAVRAIMQGALGHGFHPAPPELRLEVDRVASEAAALIAHRRRADEQLRERAEAERHRPSEESKARVAAMVEAFKKGRPVGEIQHDKSGPQ